MASTFLLQLSSQKVIPPFKSNTTQLISFLYLPPPLLLYYLLFFSLSFFFFQLSQRDMNVHGGDTSSCSFHPNQVVVGVCALCLKERLLILASNQDQLPSNNNRRLRNRSITLSSVFALGNFLRRRTDGGSDEASVTSLEDSFISIKFGDNGDALWDKNTKKTTCIKQPNNGKDSNKVRSVVEQGKLSGALRWRKQIGQLLRLARWRRSSKAATCHAGLGSNVEGVKGRRGWIRRLTRRRKRTTTNTTN